MRNSDPRPWDYKIAFGKVSNCTSWTQTGYCTSVTTTSTDIWEPGGTINWPAAAQRMELVGGAGETAAGTGIQQVQILYLDASYVEHSEIVTLTGAVAVQTVGVNLFRIQSVRAYRVGTNGVASGNIKLQGLGGGATYGFILSGFTRSRSSAWTVPAGKALYVTSCVFSTGSGPGGHNCLMTSRANYDDANNRLLTPLGLFFMPYHEVFLQDLRLFRELEVPTYFPATTDLKVSGLADAANTECTSIMRGFVVTGAIS
jgi:hypothetical protein